jgi:hypothetical protein
MLACDLVRFSVGYVCFTTKLYVLAARYMVRRDNASLVALWKAGE